MTARRFTLDTNILVYALDGAAGARHVTARQIIARAALADCHLTLQSISEFFWAVSRKRLAPATQAAEQARDWLTLFPPVAVSASAVQATLGAAVSGRMSYWDTLLVVTASEAGCETILTEDLDDGSLLHGVRVINPFHPDGIAPAAETLLAR